MTIALRQFDKIRQGIHVRFSVTIAMEELLPLPHHSHISIVQIYDLEWKIILLAGGQLLYAHLDAGLTRNASHRAFGICELHAHGCGKTKAHGSEAARVDPPSRQVKFIELGGPHLMLADIRSNKSVTAGYLIELFDHHLRLDD